MNIYRIDTPAGPVTDLFGPRLIRSRKRADEIAGEFAAIHGRATVTRISGAGQLRVVRTIECPQADNAA